MGDRPGEDARTSHGHRLESRGAGSAETWLGPSTQGGAMRFISQYPGYGVQIRQQRQEGRGDGTVNVLVPGLYVNFKSLPDGAFIYENELAAALEHFTFRGSTQLIDEATPTDPVNRLSVCDTDEMAEAEGWSDEDKLLVEQRL